MLIKGKYFFFKDNGNKIIIIHYLNTKTKFYLAFSNITKNKYNKVKNIKKRQNKKAFNIKK